MIVSTKIAGIDPGFANTGIALGSIQRGKVRVFEIHLIQTKDSKMMTTTENKLVRVLTIGDGIRKILCGSDIIVGAEVPGGAQSYSAASALGIATGVLAACPHEVVPYTPQAVKKMAKRLCGGTEKKDIINWCVNEYPTLEWPTYYRLGEENITESKAEHMADAIIVLHALADSIIKGDIS